MPKAITERIIDRDFRRVGSNLTESDVIAIIQSYIDNPTDGGAPPTDTGGGSAAKMTVTPADNIAASGYVGDTFTASEVYTLTNTGTVAITWSINHIAAWVTVSASSGSLAVDASTTVTVSINSAASNLGIGTYTDVILFNAEVA